MPETKQPKETPRVASDAERREAESTALQEGVDYYLENGLMVFTSAFLWGRGYCCERGCRHCPYGYAGDLNQAK
jgi:hypothetical protein